MTPEKNDMTYLPNLREMAEAASQGQWDTAPDNSAVWLVDGGDLICEIGNSDDDIRYIAAFDPPTVLALISCVEMSMQMSCEVEAGAKPMPTCCGPCELKLRIAALLDGKQP